LEAQVVSSYIHSVYQYNLVDHANPIYARYNAYYMSNVS